MDSFRICTSPSVSRLELLTSLYEGEQKAVKKTYPYCRCTGTVKTWSGRYS